VSEGYSAIEAVYREDHDRLWRALLGYCGQPDVATEAVAETFAQAIGRGSALHSPRDWIWRSAFRIARGMLGERRDEPITPEAEQGLPEPVVDMVRALASLPEKQRLCVVLHDYADRPVIEVAGLLGIAAPTVYVHLGRGRRRLRELLGGPDE